MKHANLDAQTRDEGFTVLHIIGAAADKTGRNTILTTKLLERRANPNLQDTNGNTPLKLAVGCCQIDVAKLLLDHKGDPTIANKKGDTALTMQTKREIKDELRSRGISIPAHSRAHRRADTRSHPIQSGEAVPPRQHSLAKRSRHIYNESV